MADESSNPDKDKQKVDRRNFFRAMLGHDYETKSDEGTSEKVVADESDNNLSQRVARALKDEEEKKEKELDRRGFFDDMIRTVLRPAAEAIEKRMDRVKTSFSSQFEPHEHQGEHDHWDEPERYLRPPGAQHEHIFLEQCQRSGRCVDACPVGAIQFFDGHDQNVAGTPYIVPTATPCVVCDGLECMNVCPSGALQIIPKEKINMGLAMVYEDICLRTSGENCTVCVDQCPLGEAAIRIKDDRVEVDVNGCIGCGVCEHYCPTYPKSIFVVPT
ncbi:MAG: 4Fe-4S dicluster domain-containing protein [Planctomycetota bacterium]|nr:4Fe-4S dicluster domain-containing protein [Planctomycetota bacterium]MDA1139338.1 4Fe-4S dicluster domain-containing protein [Planctomycetota bacterium]